MNNKFEGGNLQVVNQVPHLGWAYTGIVMNNLSLLAGNPNNYSGNIFSNSCNGIIATKCDWICPKNTFDNIQPFVAYNLPNFAGANINGTAVYARQMGKLQVFGFGAIPNVSPISFNNCKFGIITERVNTFVEATRMENCYNGIYCGSSTSGQFITVNANLINTLHKGIELNYTDPAVVAISNNTINTGAVSPATGLGCISANNYNSNTSNTTINNNILNVNRALYGIYAANVGGVIISNNQVYLNNALNRMGIGILSCNNAAIACDTISGISPIGNPNTYNSIAAQTGISVQNSTGWNISLNKTRNTTLGYRFKGICNSTENFTMNKAYQHYIGLYLPNSAGTSMGIQTHRGNRWMANSYGFNAARNESSGWALSRFFVNLPLGTQFYPNNTDPLGWFSTFLLGTPYTALVCAGGGNIVADSFDIDAFDYAIAMDSVNDPQFPTETQYIADRYLLEKLKAHIELVSSSGLIHDFYTSQTGTSIDILSGISLWESADSTYQIALDSLRNQVNLLRIALYHNDSLLNITTDSLELQNLQAEKAVLFAEIQTVSQNIQSTEAEIAAQQAAYADYLASLNATVTDSRLIVTNEQTINDIYYATLARDNYEFSPQQLADIDAIAYQCPPLGGIGVYKARSLRAWLYGEEDYADTEVCADSSISW